MKYSIIIAIVFLLLPSTYINAQEYDDFYVKFEVLSSKNDSDLIFAEVKIDEALYQKIKMDNTINGQVMPIYDSETKNKHELRGKATELEANKWEIQLKDTPENQALIKDNKGLLMINAQLETLGEENIIYDIFRLGIGMTDIYGEKNFIQWVTSDNIYNSKEVYILKSLLDETKFVAGEMKKQMDSPDVKEGRFKGMDLFSAMEAADNDDVKSFLRYVKTYPFKYQGTDWKFSEIFATWIAEGSPTPIDDLKDLATASWGEDTYFLKYFNDVDPSVTKEILEYVRGECGDAADNENLEYAHTLANNALILAKFIDDPYEIAWSEYKQAKVFTEEENYVKATPLYEKSMEYFNREKVKSGILVGGNDAADNYNKLGGKTNYKKAIALLETSIDLASGFGKEDKTISPVTALMYRNIGKSYQGLKKYKQALGYYQEGLEYTAIATPTALKRKATLELYISEIYELTGESDLAEEYSNKAVNTYLKYEAALAAIKKL